VLQRIAEELATNIINSFNRQTERTLLLNPSYATIQMVKIFFSNSRLAQLLLLFKASYL